MTLTENELDKADDCTFCAIVRGGAEASVVHQDDEVITFMDLQPITPGHSLVVPRRHAVGLEDLPEAVGVHMWTQAHRLARGLRRSDLRCEGVNMFLADGEAAFQEVPADPCPARCSSKRNSSDQDRATGTTGQRDRTRPSLA